MEARVEFLERGFEGMIKTREDVASLKRLFEEEHIERAELKAQMAELMTVVRILSSTDRGSGNCDHAEQQNRDREVKWRKLEIPIFDGGDAFGWANKMERYFETKGVEEEDRIQAAMVAMEGKALTWYQWWEFCEKNPNWTDFKNAVIQRFQPSMNQSPYKLLLSLKHEGTVEEYREKFELYAGPLRGTELEYLKGIFLNGLKEVVRAELKLDPVNTLPELMDYAQWIEEKNSLMEKGNVGGNRGGPTRSYSSSRTVTWDPGNKGTTTKTREMSSSLESNSVKSTGAYKGRPFRRLSDAEFQERAEKGLCYRCNGEFGPGEGQDEEDEKEGAINEKNLQSIQLSLYSMPGLTSKKSIRLWGNIATNRVIILVDCGASHNFISDAIVKQQQIPITPTKPYSVEVGDGRKIRCEGVSKNVKLQIQLMEIQQDLFVFEMTGVDVVLGMEWLASLGEIRANFRELTLKIPTTEGSFTLKGEPAMARSAASLRSIAKVLQNEGEGFLLCCRSLPAVPEASLIPAWMEGILEEYHEIFQDPSGLPPSRRQDHSIELKNGVEIPNIRPYRYPHYQKNEIEKLVDDMLNSGIIRPSISPYASPIILVKKKDRG
eukprot:XP_006593215.1 uncharacterized protein LOC102668698 [Glycine max]